MDQCIRTRTHTYTRRIVWIFDTKLLLCMIGFMFLFVDYYIMLVVDSWQYIEYVICIGFLFVSLFICIRFVLEWKELDETQTTNTLLHGFQQTKKWYVFVLFVLFGFGFVCVLFALWLYYFFFVIRFWLFVSFFFFLFVFVRMHGQIIIIIIIEILVIKNDIIIYGLFALYCACLYL